MKKSLQSLVKIIVLLSVFCNIPTASAQAPQKMSYQAVIRNAGNVLVANSNVGMRVSILQTSASGTAVYTETHQPTTNINGLAAFEIGGGTVVSGNFAAINWANGPYFIKTETDPNGGNNYTITGTSQLLSVPFALYAASSGSPASNPSLSSESLGSPFQTLRNQWIECPDVSITVPEDGKYLITFYGNAENGNFYQIIPANTIFDFNCEVRVIIEGVQEVFRMTATSRLWHDGTSNGNFITPGLYTYINRQPSRTVQLNLTAGQVLKIEYIQNLSEGTGTLTTPWNIGASGISIVKIGN